MQEKKSNQISCFSLTSIEKELFAFIIHSKTKLAANRILSSKVSVYKISTTIELVQ